MFSSRKSSAPAAGGYNLTKSLRFRSSAGAYLNRTPASAGNRKTWTWSGWVKRGTLGVRGTLFHAYDGSADQRGEFYFDSSDRIVFYKGGVSGEGQITTVSVFRDPAAWYHVVIKADYSNGTSADRAIIYVNNVAQTVTVNATFANADGQINGNWAHSLGSQATGQYFDGYMAEVNFIDGQALTPSSFGETSAATGVWQPIRYTGTYGTNGFYLDFEDTSSTAALGTDFSGNSNTWTVNNISLTSGSTYDSMNDVPTLTSATTANYCVLNPLDKGGTVNPKNGNLGFANTAGTYNIVRSTVGITSGKWYFEYTIVDSASIGGGSTSAGLVRYDSVLAGKYLGQDTNTLGSVSSGTPSLLLYNGTNKALSSGLNSFSVGAVIQYAYDADAGKLWVGVNNSWDGGNDPSTGSTPTLSSGFAGSSGPWFFAANGLTSPDDVAVNFGQRPFAYTPPTGFVALNTFNLPTPTIGATASSQANDYMNIALYTGTGSSLSVTGVGFQPDWTWIKGRSGATDHGLYDAVRGVQKQLESNTTSVETTETTGLTAFGSDGFTVGALAQLNTSSATYVAWNWKANGAGVSNTSGSITSTVSASTTAGFSIVTYTGTGANATVGHGLGVAPSIYIVKRRNNDDAWFVYSNQLAATQYLRLNSTNPVATFNFWQNTAPTSSVFYISTDVSVNASSDTYVAYCFAPVAGYSAFGSYTGNGSTDGPFIFTGFRPRYIMIKALVEISNWFVYDTARNTYNTMYDLLFPSDAGATYSDSTYAIDVVSNGFKIRGTGQFGGLNNNGNSYIYMAFAENPFKYANAR